MKILYAVQATGNGHISRAMELLPYLEKYGSVDILLSGANSTLELSAPVKYRSKGLSLFYTCSGGLNYSRIFRQLSLPRIRKDIRDLPVEKYDLVLNDFDCITSLACSRKKIPSIHFGHQASFLSPKTPRPVKPSKTGEWILKNYVNATHLVGLHFQSYDDFILSPVIKKNVLHADPLPGRHVTIYLPSYCQEELLKFFSPLKEVNFEIFSWEVTRPEQYGHIKFIPVSNAGFTESLINGQGIICGAGFETPAEALYLGKKMMVMPIKGQYEQLCNAAALHLLGVKTIRQLDEYFSSHFYEWMNQKGIPRVKFPHSTEEIVAGVMKKANHYQEVAKSEEFLESAFLE